MTTQFEIRLSTTEGALLRTLGLIQRRGFGIDSLSLHASAGGQLLKIAVDGHQRCPQVLARQIGKLHDVQAIAEVPADAWQHTVADCMQALASLLPAQPARADVAVGMGR